MESIEDHKTLGVVRKIEANMSLRAANVFEIKKIPGNVIKTKRISLNPRLSL